MKKNIKLVRIIIAAVVFIAGLVLGINGYTKRMSDSYAALKEAGTNGSVDMLYAIGLVLVIIGIVIFIAAVTAPKESKDVPIIVLAEAALLAALCYVGAGYLKIDIPVGTEKTMFHLGKVFKWLKKQGGLAAMKERNEKKAKILYDFLDQSKLFKGTVVPKDRSLMNVPFVTGNEELDAKFVKEAAAAGFVNLKGHRTVGGMRASIYNAMPIEGVEKLVEFMKKFEEENA